MYKQLFSVVFYELRNINRFYPVWEFFSEDTLQDYLTEISVSSLSPFALITLRKAAMDLVKRR